MGRNRQRWEKIFSFAGLIDENGFTDGEDLANWIAPRLSISTASAKSRWKRGGEVALRW